MKTYIDFLVNEPPTVEEIQQLSVFRNDMVQFAKKNITLHQRVPTSAFLLVRQDSYLEKRFEYSNIRCNIPSLSKFENPIAEMMRIVTEEIITMKLDVCAFGLVGTAITGIVHADGRKETENSVIISLQHRMFKETNIYAITYEPGTGMLYGSKLLYKKSLYYEKSESNIDEIVPLNINCSKMN